MLFLGTLHGRHLTIQMGQKYGHIWGSELSSNLVILLCQEQHHLFLSDFKEYYYYVRSK